MSATITTLKGALDERVREFLEGLITPIHLQQSEIRWVQGRDAWEYVVRIGGAAKGPDEA